LKHWTLELTDIHDITSDIVRVFKMARWILVTFVRYPERDVSKGDGR
jgi:hypothetical protein